MSAVSETSSKPASPTGTTFTSKNLNYRRVKSPLRIWLGRLFKIGLGLGLVALVVLAVMPKPLVVESAVITRGEFVETVDEDGKARVKDRYVVSAPLNGHVARLELRVGDVVKQGSVLARIVPLSAPLLDARSRRETEARVRAAAAAQKQAYAQIERARGALAFAVKAIERQRALNNQGSGTADALDRAELELHSRKAELTSSEFGAKVADYELEVARAALTRLEGGNKTGDQLDVLSPVNGRILNIMQASEGVVQAGVPLLEVGDPAALEVVVDVLTRDAVKIQAGARATLSNWGGKALGARVRLIEPSATTRISALGVEEQRVNAILDVTEPYSDWSALNDGYRLEASIEVWRAADVVRAPGSALFREQGQWAVYVIETDRAKKRTVSIGRHNGLFAVIEAGLEPNERVIVHPSDNVVDGVRVR